MLVQAAGKLTFLSPASPQCWHVLHCMQNWLPADKDVSAMKGAKVDVFFHPKTEPQKVDQQVFFKETLPRLDKHLQKVLQETKSVKWNLMYHCTLEMPDKYRTEPMTYEGYCQSVVFSVCL